METILQVRYLALLLLAFAGYAQAADIAVTRCWEPDGPYAESGKCPAQISVLGASSITTTSYVIGHTTNTATTTTYYYTVANPAGAVCTTLAPTRKAHISGSGAVAASTTTIAGTGAQTKTISGLSPDSAYCTFVLQMTGYRASNRLALAVQTAPTTPVSDDMVLSGYFVGEGGCTNRGGSATIDGVSVTCNGTAPGRRFAHFGVLPTTAASGTDIWWLRGSEHSVVSYGKVETKWGGSSMDPTDPGTAYIGCYYIDTGDSDAPTACWEGTQAGTLDNTLPTAKTTLAMGTHTMPTVVGALTDDCLAADNCDWDYDAASFPNECGSGDQAIFSIKHSYVTVRGITISRSRCRAVTIDPDGDVTIEGVIYRDNISEKSGYQSFVVGRFARFSVAKHNILRRAGRCALSREYGGTSEPIGGGNCNPNGAHSGGAVVSNVGAGAYFGMVDNTLIDTYSEGIQCNNSSHVWFKGNRTGNTVFSANYLDACENAVSESNIFWSTQGDIGQTNGRAWNTNTAAARTIVEHANAQSPLNSIKSTVRNNLFSYMGQGYVLAKQKQNTTASDLVGISLYHNTFIGARQRLLYTHSAQFVTNNGVDVIKIDVRNNIFQGPDGSLGTKCFDDPDATYDYNLWGRTGLDTVCRGANDVGGIGSAGNPGLTLNSGASWEGFDSSDPPDPDNARLVADTNVGTDLNDNGACVSDIATADLANWAVIAHEMDYPYSLDANTDGSVTAAELANWKQCAYYDFWGNPRANTPNMGMHEHGGSL